MIRNLILLAIVIIAIAMIYLGYTGSMLPPILTGVGFLLIAYLLYKRNSIF